MFHLNVNHFGTISNGYNFNYSLNGNTIDIGTIWTYNYNNVNYNLIKQKQSVQFNKDITTSCSILMAPLRNPYNATIYFPYEHRPQAKLSSFHLVHSLFIPAYFINSNSNYRNGLISFENTIICLIL